jgi:hypothetical protein
MERDQQLFRNEHFFDFHLTAMICAETESAILILAAERRLAAGSGLGNGKDAPVSRKI